jgi:K+-transporting ATPase ATPase C chain
MIKTALKLMLCMTVLTGFLYPMAITAAAQIFFPWKANGSLIEQNGQKIGSELIGQNITGSHYFWGRPSASQIGGSNSGPSNPDYIKTVQARVNALRDQHAQSTESVPVNLVTASGSGLDPHISPEAAFYQVARVANANQIPEADIHALVESHIEKRTWGIFGEPRINVLTLNIALDQLRSVHAGTKTQSQ